MTATQEILHFTGRVLLAALATFITFAMTACGGGSSGSDSAGSGSGTGTGTGTDGGNGPGPAAAAPVVYVADQDSFEVYELYVADAANPAGSAKLNGPMVAGGWVDEYTVTQDNKAVVYTADQDTLYRRELYIVQLAHPGQPTKLNAPMTVNRDVYDFAVSADGTKVAYRADQDADDVFELYLVDVAHPGIAVKLSDGLAAGGWVRSEFEFSPDGTKLAYRADQDQLDTVELYLVDVAQPGQSQKLNSALVAGGNVLSVFSFSPDGATIGYVADQDTDETIELYAVPVATPGTTSKLNGPLIAQGDVCRFEFSPDSTRVAYCADQDTDEVLELYTASLAVPGASSKLNAPLVAGGEVTSGYEFGPASDFVVYAANQDDAARTDLYRVEIAAPGTAVRINADLTAGGSVVGFHLRPDGTHVGYVANQEDGAVHELYEADFAAPGAVTKLSAPMSAAGVFRFRYAADGASVIYLADQESDVSQIYRVKTATPGDSTRLNGTLTAGGEVWDFTLAH